MSRRTSNIAKGIAILMMLFHHAFYSAAGIADYGNGQQVAFDPFTQAEVIAVASSMKVCVAVFVFVTAYGTFKQFSGRLDSATGKDRSAARYSASHALKLLMNIWTVFIPLILLGFFVP